MTPSFAVRQSGPPFFLTQASGTHPVWMCPRCFSLLRFIRPAEADGSRHHLIGVAFHHWHWHHKRPVLISRRLKIFWAAPQIPKTAGFSAFFILFRASGPSPARFCAHSRRILRRRESNSISSLSVPFQSLSEERFFRTFRQKSRSIVKKAVIFQVESNVFVCYTEIDSTIRKSFH